MFNGKIELLETIPEIISDNDKHFYSDIYDHLVYNNLKDDYEIGEIINKTGPTVKSKILDVGCGTGHQVANLASKGFHVVGIDLSESMIKKCKEKYPKYNYQRSDVLDTFSFQPSTFTHIMCMYFTIYYIKNKTQFFDNCMKWLVPGGYLIIHLVDPEKFDPILPPGNPLMYVSPQKYAKKRITQTTIKFNDFTYKSKFDLKENEEAVFSEKIIFDKNGYVRKNEHKMYMPNLKDMADFAQNSGFVLQSIIDLVNCQYEYQYLYIFTKVN
jgi:SAM-dependent methyltransferase